VSALALPTGLTLADAKIAEKKDEAKVVLNAAVEAPLGAMTIALVAKGKFGQVEETIAAPELSLNVVRPVTLELASPSLEVKPGESVELKAKVVRKGTFKEEVTAKLTSSRPA